MDYSNILFEKYQTALLTTEQVAEVLGRSVHSLTNDRRAGVGVNYKRTGTAPNSPVRYPLHEVSKFLNDTEKTL